MRRRQKGTTELGIPIESYFKPTEIKFDHLHLQPLCPPSCPAMLQKDPINPKLSGIPSTGTDTPQEASVPELRSKSPREVAKAAYMRSMRVSTDIPICHSISCHLAKQVSADGHNWTDAELSRPPGQPLTRTWAWTQWQAPLMPAVGGHFLVQNPRPTWTASGSTSTTAVFSAVDYSLTSTHRAVSQDKLLSLCFPQSVCLSTSICQGMSCIILLEWYSCEQFLPPTVPCSLKLF